ncbi:hypothetical protein DFQ26_003093 [Actinomortierella ambigua]|nr:hypothetical protein DFQ26_003093 [Actinomortierella ambigua]
MAFFKINKNKTASAASSPAQTPRPSMQQQVRVVSDTMTEEQVIKMIHKTTIAGSLPSSTVVGHSGFSVLK